MQSALRKVFLLCAHENIHCDGTKIADERMSAPKTPDVVKEEKEIDRVCLLFD